MGNDNNDKGGVTMEELLAYLKENMITKNDLAAFKAELREEFSRITRRLDKTEQTLNGLGNRLDVLDDRWRLVDTRLQAVEQQ